MFSVGIVHNPFCCDGKTEPAFLVGADISNDIVTVFAESAANFAFSRCCDRHSIHRWPSYCRRMSTAALQYGCTHQSQTQSAFSHMRRLQSEKRYRTMTTYAHWWGICRLCVCGAVLHDRFVGYMELPSLARQHNYREETRKGVAVEYVTQSA